jgi:hypothetical protein
LLYEGAEIMTRISSYLLMASLITLVGCSSKKPPPTAPAPEQLDKAPTVVVPATPDKDKAAGKDKEPTGSPTTPAPGSKGVLTRAEFRGLVGKTKDDVLRRIGPADSTGKDGDDEYWFYNERTTNDDGTVDERANVTLQNGVVKRVFFKPRD